MALRRLIASGLSEIVAKKSALPKGLYSICEIATHSHILAEPVPTFDSVLADYVPKSTFKAISSLPPAAPSPPVKPDYFDGLF